MARINKKTASTFTHEGAKSPNISPYLELRRTIMACLLWEDGFYESGVSVADRIHDLAHLISAQQLSELAIEARNTHHLRHAPLLLTRELARHKEVKGSTLVASTLQQVINRPDELAEFLALYWGGADRRKTKEKLTRQVKQGLAAAFTKFDEYQLAKYNRDNGIKLVDVLFMVHAKPKDQDQAELWKRLIEGKLAVPDTWEVRLSGGEDKGEVFTDLLKRNRIGYLAALRNLRNMQQTKVDKRLIADYLMQNKGISQILPFRFIAAARAVPAWEDIIEPAMLKATASMEKLPGKTIILVDRSGSMEAQLSSKSDLSRGDAAAALAVLLREVCEEVEVWWFTAGEKNSGYVWLAQTPPRRGFALAELLQPLNAGTDLGGAVKAMLAREYDRLIVLTDEQSSTDVPQPTSGQNYMINIANYRNGVGYGQWIHIDGFSESIIRFVHTLEAA